MEKSIFVDVHERSLGAVSLAGERLHTTRAYQLTASRHHFYGKCPTTAGTSTSGHKAWRRGTPTASQQATTLSEKKEKEKTTTPEEATQPAQGTDQQSETTLTDEVILRRAEMNAPEHKART